ncbi:MAG TPA: MATE family efflux transporter [Kiloniellales bacterium]|nr:MATE family efflux transporter [Kiloniellales bacterium]
MSYAPPTSRWRDELAATLHLAWPLVLMQLAQMSINLTEVVLVGHLGATELAGAGLGSQVFHAVFLFSLGLAIAVAPLVAQARGAREYRTIRRSVRQGLWATTIIAVPGVAILWCVRPILIACGQDPVVAEQAEDFARPVSVGLAPWLWFFVLRNFMAAMGKPRPALYVMLAAIVLNAVLGYGLVFGKLGLPEWGVTGAGVAAAIVDLFLPLALLLFIERDRQLRRFAVLGRLWVPDWHLFREIFRIGTPIGLALLFETTLFLVALFLQGLISTVAQAAHQVAVQPVAVAFMVPLGISQAATVRVGLAVGRGDPAGAAIAAKVSLWMGVACTLLTAAILLAIPETLIGAFLDSDEPETPAVIAAGASFLAVAALFQLADGGQVIAMGSLRGLKDTRVPMLIAAVGYWLVGVPLSLLLGFHWGLNGVGIWLGLAGGLVAAALMLVVRLRGQLRQLSGQPARSAALGSA